MPTKWVSDHYSFLASHRDNILYSRKPVQFKTAAQVNKYTGEFNLQGEGKNLIQNNYKLI